MAAKGSVSKHADPNQRVRLLGKDPVKIVLYNGHNVGHGKYLTGEVNGKIVTDATGKPVPLRSIGELVRISSLQ